VPERPRNRIEIRHEPAAGPTGATLLAAMEATLADLYGFDSLGATPSAHPEELSPPHGAFVVVYEDGEPVACGGLKRLAPGLAEIKRMYTAPEARGRGHARRVLAALEDAARALGYARVRLDTGSRQPHARALYESAGYALIEDYNGNVYAAHWFEKGLKGS